MKPTIFLPEAREEMNEAVCYYESQALGLGIDYLSEVERAVASISEYPMTWPKIEGELRRLLTRIRPPDVKSKRTPVTDFDKIRQ